MGQPRHGRLRPRHPRPALLGQRRRDGVLLRAGGEGGLRGDAPRRPDGVAPSGRVAARRRNRGDGRAGADLHRADDVHRPGGAEPRMGDPVRDRHRLLRDDRARHLPGRSSRDSVPAPAGHRRRRDGPDRAGRFLSLGLALVPGAGRPDERCATARVVAATTQHDQLLAVRDRAWGAVVGRAVLGRLPSRPRARPDRPVHAAQRAPTSACSIPARRPGPTR